MPYEISLRSANTVQAIVNGLTYNLKKYFHCNNRTYQQYHTDSGLLPRDPSLYSIAHNFTGIFPKFIDAKKHQNLTAAFASNYADSTLQYFVDICEKNLKEEPTIKGLTQGIQKRTIYTPHNYDPLTINNNFVCRLPENVKANGYIAVLASNGMDNNRFPGIILAHTPPQFSQGIDPNNLCIEATITVEFSTRLDPEIYKRVKL